MDLSGARKTAKRYLKRAIVTAGLEAVALSGLRHIWRAPAGRGVIFTLHRVGPKSGSAFEPNASLSITPEFLETAILTARACGLTPAHVDELPRLLADPGDRRRFVCFSLDDGYRDNARYAAPVFLRHQIPFTLFVTKGFVERTRTLWWVTAEAMLRAAGRLEFDFGAGGETLRTQTAAEKTAAFDRLTAWIGTIDEDEAVRRIDAAAAAHGVDGSSLADDIILNARELRVLANGPLARLGAHTVTHVNLRRMPPERVAFEMAESARAVQSYCGYFPRAFSFPYGQPDAVGVREVAAAASAGFSVAVTTTPGTLAPSGARHPMELPRVSLNGLYQRARYAKALISGIPFRSARSAPSA